VIVILDLGLSQPFNVQDTYKEVFVLITNEYGLPEKSKFPPVWESYQFNIPPEQPVTTVASKVTVPGHAKKSVVDGAVGFGFTVTTALPLKVPVQLLSLTAVTL
jgi:hypothetical protein